MFRLALMMLMRDRAKYAMLLSGLTFCALLITQQGSVFSGLMNWTTATIQNLDAPVWVMDEKVERADDNISMRAIETSIVRSQPGVDWAVPTFWGLLQARLSDGNFLAIQVVGLDSGTLIGRPTQMTEGRAEDLRLPNAVVIDQVAVEKLRKHGIEPKIGQVFEINDREARIVGICKSKRSFLGQPYVFTTYERALQFAPEVRKRLSYVLVGPKPGVDARQLAAQLDGLANVRAIERNDFYWETIRWYFRNTGIPISFGTVIILGAIVGIAVAGQTFYLFVHENIRFLAAFKAMGASTRVLAGMVLLQAFFVGLIGYGLGVGLAASFGRGVVEAGQPPFYMTWQLLAFTAAVIFLVCLISSIIGLRKVIKLEAAMVFR